MSGSVLGPGSTGVTGRQGPHLQRVYKSLLGSLLVPWCLMKIHHFIFSCYF